MSNVRVGQINRARIAEQIEHDERQQQIKLFTHSRYEAQRKTFAGIGKPDLSALTSSSSGQGDDAKAGKDDEVDEAVSLKLQDGTRIEVPRLSDEQYSKIDAILARATPEQAQHLVRTGQQLGAAAYTEVNEGRTEAPFGLEASRAARSSYEAYVATAQQTTNEDARTGAVLFGMYGVEVDLTRYFHKVQGEQQVASDLRTDVAEIEGMLADWPDDGSKETFSYREVTFNEDGSITVVEHKDVTMSKEEAEALVDKLKGQIESLGQFDNREMATLQQMVNRYQQAMNTLSNIMKNMDETHKGIIGNIR